MHATQDESDNIDVASLEVTTTCTPKQILHHDEIAFGRSFTDHMMLLEWNAPEGWLAPKIIPYQNLSFDPATCGLHYAFGTFEALKAYKSNKGNVGLFRPDKSIVRMNKAAQRLALPSFNDHKVVELIRRFVELEARFVPAGRGYSLYVRPNIIATQATLNVGPPSSALLYVIASPTGPPKMPSAQTVDLEAVIRNENVGDPNASMVQQVLAASISKQKSIPKLWLKEAIDTATTRSELYVTDAGTMNLFFAMIDESGHKVLATHPLDGQILDGVMRDCVLELARERLVSEGWIVVERKVSMQALIGMATEGKLLEVFGSNTATTVTPVRSIRYQNQEINCESHGEGQMESVAALMKIWIEDIQYGDEEHHWRVKCN